MPSDSPRSRLSYSTMNVASATFSCYLHLLFSFLTPIIRISLEFICLSDELCQIVTDCFMDIIFVAPYRQLDHCITECVACRVLPSKGICNPADRIEYLTFPWVQRSLLASNDVITRCKFVPWVLWITWMKDSNEWSPMFSTKLH